MKIILIQDFYPLVTQTADGFFLIKTSRNMQLSLYLPLDVKLITDWISKSNRSKRVLTSVMRVNFHKRFIYYLFTALYSCNSPEKVTTKLKIKFI